MKFSLYNKVIFICIFLMLINILSGITLRVGIYDNEPLLYVDSQGNPKGLFVDVINEVAIRENWTLIFVYREWNELLDMLQKQEIDILADIAYTKQREEIFNFNKTNVFVNWGQLYSKKNSGITSFLDIEGKTVAGVEGDIYFNSLVELLNSFSISFEPLIVKDYIDVFEAIENEQAHVGTVNRMYGMLHSGSYKIEDTLIIFRPTELRYAAPKDKFSIILSTIDFYIEQMKKDKNSVYYKSLETHIAGLENPKKEIAKVIKIAVFWFLAAVALILILILVIKKKNVILRNLFLINKSIKLIYALEENIPLPCIHFNDKGIITYANSAFTQYSGMKSNELLKTNIYDFFSYFNINEISNLNTISKITFIKDNKSFSVIKNHFKNEPEYIALSVEHPEVLKHKMLLSTQKQNINAVFDFFPNSMLISDKKGTILQVNKKLINDFFFLSKENFFKNNHTLWDIFDLQTAEKIINSAMINKDKYFLIEQSGYFFNANHDEVKISLSLINITEYDIISNDNIDKLYIIVKNVSYEEKIRKDFLLSTEFFKKLFESSPNSILILDRNEKIIDLNLSFEKTFGYTKETAINKKLSDFFISQEYKTETLKIFDKIITDGSFSTETYGLHFDGRLLKVKLTGTVIKVNEEILGIYAIYEDITEESLRLKQFKNMQLKYDILMRNSQDIIALVDENNLVIDVSDSFCEITGWSKSDMFEREKLLGLIHPEDKEFVEKSFLYILKKKEKRYNVKYRFQHKKGHYVWIDELGSYIENCSNALQGVLFVSRDITETKRFEEKLTRQKEFFGTLMNYFEEALLIINDNNEIQFFNNSFKNQAELEDNEIIGKPYYEIFSYIDKIPKEKLPVDFKQKKCINIKNKQLLFKQKNKRIICDISIIPFEENRSNVQNIVIISDLTKSKKLNLEINKIKNIDTLKNYTLHLANDFNNVLTAIMGHISLLKMSSGLSTSSYNRITKAEEAALKAIEITQKIFPLQNVTNIIKTTFEVSNLFNNIELHNNSQLKLNIPDSNKLLNTNFVMMKEVVRILIENSIESIIEKDSSHSLGLITVDVSNLNLNVNDKLPLNDGVYDILTIKDNGIGINNEYIDDIYEPYFSTKNKDGFGLTKALHLLRLLSCHLTIDSIENQGTTATIYIPKTNTIEQQSVYPDITTKDIKIIFMDDEHLVQDIAKEFMHKLGFDIDIASNGEEVLEKFKTKKFDFYILDMIVDEGMGARETALKLLKIDPSAKMFLTTGMKTDKAFFEYKNIGFIEIIEKPIDFYQLKNKILKHYDIYLKNIKNK